MSYYVAAERIFRDLAHPVGRARENAGETDLRTAKKAGLHQDNARENTDKKTTTRKILCMKYREQLKKENMVT